jgi:hypothetical protein
MVVKIESYTKVRKPRIRRDIISPTTNPDNRDEAWKKWKAGRVYWKKRYWKK